MKLPFVRLHSFGCRLNQLETEAVALAFSRAGFPVGALGDAEDELQPSTPSEASPLPSLIFINTCTVTSKAEQKARRLIRAACREEAQPLVIVSGCYAELDGSDIRALGPRVIVLPGSFKDALIGLPARLAARAAEGGHADAQAMVAEEIEALCMGERDPFAFSAADFRFHSRASLKVQDGCDNACSYCRVRIARGPSRSLEPAEVLRRARELEAAGWAEVVLTGVNLSQYEAGDLTLGGLLSLLHRETHSLAFRLSSFEPDRIDKAFFQAAALPRVRPFFHFPLQSASPAVLARMGRPKGTPKALLGAIERLRALREDPFISLDLICGFPGETEEDAALTRAFVKEAAPASLHVFTYSARPGTAAVSMQPAVPERLAVERSARLLALSAELRAAYVQRQGGRSLEAVLEGGPREGPWPRRAFTANALTAALERDPGMKAGAGLRLRVLSAASGGEFDLLCGPEPADAW